MDLIAIARRLRRIPAPAMAIGVAIAGCAALPVFAQIAVALAKAVNQSLKAGGFGPPDKPFKPQS